MNGNTRWSTCKNLLCVRLDNMGDVLFTSPALKALKKQNSNRKITLLTSAQGSKIAKFIPEIDHTIAFDAPWVKNEQTDDFFKIIQKIKNLNFDAGIIFTNFSQNPQPASLILYLASIPKRLAYCRENPYYLLTDWVPDEEPYKKIEHGVIRQLNLVKYIGAETDDDSFSLKLMNVNLEKFRLPKNYIVLHPEASEKKRMLPHKLLAKTAKLLKAQTGLDIVLTGQNIDYSLFKDCISLVGKLQLEELFAVIKKAKLLISVNSLPVHIASAVNTPVIVLYARTNPEHTPWKVKNKTIYFDPPKFTQSKNTLLNFIKPKDKISLSTPDQITQASKELLYAKI